ncbi:hypothetical protein [Verrucomicrobium sp. BvORR034]|uniref:hypothetical protein n=1 Tax=Verrucomicrobium sp. BvORR034 TaxID=1396418 RepID=UPI000679C048|nr:hypothetical protein [Verrucomicrobium sp. BvORR034]
MSKPELLGDTPVKSPATKYIAALGLVVIGVALAVAGIYVGETDDAPGAALLGFLLMIASAVIAVRIVRRKS